MAHSGWTDADEKALLAMLQKKHCESGYASASSVPVPPEAMGAMSDGSKRLREAVADDGFDLVSVSAEQMPVVPTPLFPGVADKDLDRLAVTFLPKGLTLREWSRTKFAFGKLERSGKTYREVYLDDEYTGYRKWCMDHLGRPSCGPTSRDWHSFLCACQVIEDAGLGVNKSKTHCFPGSNVPRELGD